jgi:hypothetical protein
MHSRLYNRMVRVAVAVVLLAAMSFQAAAAVARPEPGARRERRGFSLFAEVFTLFLVNRVACGINNLGEVCVDPGNSPIGGGGFWPRGTPDQYIFNSGLQIAGIIPADVGFEWAGDTVGAYFMDPRGTQAQGDGVTPVFNSLDPVDAQDWPNGAIVRDTAVYADVLLGRSAVSQQDLWVRSWDGNPNLLSGRTHPMGMLVEMRGMAWNFPSGNEDILYFVFNFYNVTASDPAAYAGLDPAIQGEIAAIGATFQQGVQATLGVDIPDGGYPIQDLYAAFFMDPDVEDASHNYSTAILPFQLAAAYKFDFQAPSWVFPPDIFGAPFEAAPGFVGVKYLRSPVNPATNEQVGLTIFSNTNNSASGFPDPVGVIQMWRYLSGNVSQAAGDNPCSVNDPIGRQLCYLEQQDLDTRFYMSSGPFTLGPGQSGTIVVAYVHAAPVAAWVTPGVDLKPQIPPNGVELATGTSVRTIDQAVGWVSHTDINGDGEITQDEVSTVPRSLLQKSLVAQEIFRNKFLLPFAPEPPNFFVVPGPDQVTIVWEPSPTETLGDPYFEIANADSVENDQGVLVGNALFDPNFRQFDVEGYRVYRGRTAGALGLIAQFDYTGTTFVDFTGAINYGNCAPELGITTDCPVTFDFPITKVGATNTVDITGNVIQVPPGGRVELADGSVFVLNADTAVTGGGSGDPALTNSGVPFALVDRGVRNSLTYFYAVTAFDVNSVASGPTSLESAPIARAVVPRGLASNAQAVVLSRSVTGDDDQPLDLTAPWPTIDPENGTFSGNVPPTDAGTFDFLAAVLEALPPGDIQVQIDSVNGGFQGGFGDSPNLFVTMSAGGNAVQASTSTNQPNFDADGSGEYELSAPVVPYDSALSQRLGLTFQDPSVRMPVQFSGTSVPFAHTSPSVATGSGRYAVEGYETARYLAHSRWFDEGGSEPPDPTIKAYADSSQHAGTLTGVGRIYSPSAYRQELGDVNAFLRGFNAAGSTAWYPADFVVEWQAGGAITVRDVTHNVNLPYSGGTTASGYSFFNLADILATGITQGTFDFEFALSGSGVFDIINYQHLFMIEPTCLGYWGVVSFPCAVTSETAELSPLDFDNDGAQDGMGVVLIVNGEPFFMEMTALPAAGTRWHLRAITGQMTADCTPALGSAITDCSNYTFEPNPVRPTNVPGLRYKITVEEQFAVDPNAEADLALVHTVPDPYYVTNPMEITANRKVLRFVNLPAQAIIRIYSLSGVLLNIIEHNDPTGGGQATWNLRNRNDQFVASGVYFYHLETPGGQERVGRFTVVNFAQ